MQQKINTFKAKYFYEANEKLIEYSRWNIQKKKTINSNKIFNTKRKSLINNQKQYILYTLTEKISTAFQPNQ